MEKKMMILLALGAAGIGCVIAFRMIGQTIDQNGVLHEPFFLAPIGSLLLLIGFGGAALLGLWRLLRRSGQS